MILIGFVTTAVIATLVRWQITQGFGRAAGTALVNIVGAFVLGLTLGISEGASTIAHIAGLGSLTTFSTLAVELTELHDRRPGRAWAYGAFTVVGGVLAAWVGLRLT